MKKDKIKFDKVSSFEDCIIEVPLAEVFVNGVSKGFHNEYTIRRLQLAVYRKELPNNITFKYKEQESNITIDNNGYNCKIRPAFISGMFDISSELAFALLD